MTGSISKSILYESLCDEISDHRTITKAEAEQIFAFFKVNKLFRWQDANNDCEDRANALCMLLDAWHIPNYKGWVFSGYFLKKGTSSLTNGWNYHVAALLPVSENNKTDFYIIDPATSDTVITLYDWATAVTETAFSYHIKKTSDYYIFSSSKIKKDNWHKRDKRNYRWTMQGLSGINGVSTIGKAQLRFNKNKVKRAEELFKKLKDQKPFGDS